VTESSAHDVLGRMRVDFAPVAEPVWGRFAVAVAVAAGCSLGADAALVHACVALFPSTRGFSHFRFSDYATLTCIGVILASAGWPLVIRVSSSPRWLFLRAAIVVTILAWGPDIWLLAKGETPRGVVVLAVMHLAVALITYNALVRIAPERERHKEQPRPAYAQRDRADLRAWWVTMIVAVLVVFTLGVLAIVAVPISRPSGWVPSKGKAIFVFHGALGAAVLVASFVLVVWLRRAARIARLASIGGVIGIVIGGAGGLLAVEHGLRLAGMGLMFVGSGIALGAYLIPLVESSAETREQEARIADETSDGEEPLVT
jgi:hypothetical protein